jgi:hypothetical protein
MRPINLERCAQYAGFVTEGKGRVHDSVITIPETSDPLRLTDMQTGRRSKNLDESARTYRPTREPFAAPGGRR